MRYDVIVVGAGPAGSTTARECAGRGLSVLLLDKTEFPRDKPCGGGVTVRAARLLPFDIAPVVERVAYGINITLHQSQEFTRHSSSPIFYLTQRRHLDAFLLNSALEEGVTLRERSAIREVNRHESHVVVRTNSEAFEGRSLVAADGVNGKTAALAGATVKSWFHVALEGNITPTNGVPEKWRNAFGLDMGGIPGGYGWLFPKGDHLNVGAGGWKFVGPTLRKRVDRLAQFYGFDPSEVWGLRGHHLPIRQPDSPLADGNLLLVGDAAGLIDPMTDEGIHSAIWSGRVAAKHLTAYVGGEIADLSAYQREVERELVMQLWVSRRFHDLFHLSPALFLKIERHTLILWKLASRIMRGEQTYTGVMSRHNLINTAIDFGSDLVRVTPFLQRLAGLQYPAPPQRFFHRNAQHQ